MKIKIMKAIYRFCTCDLNHNDKSSRCIINRQINNNNNNICLKSNIQTSSVDYAPRELTHACLLKYTYMNIIMQT